MVVDISTVIGVLFGGGALISLVIFLIKRHDEQKKDRKRFYKDIQLKLIKYKSDLDSILSDYIQSMSRAIYTFRRNQEGVQNLIRLQEQRHSEIKLLIDGCSNDVDDMKQTIERCHEIKTSFESDSNKIDGKLQEIQGAVDSAEDFWGLNFERLQKVADTHKGLQTHILLDYKSSKKVQSLVRKIDDQTMAIIGINWTNVDTQKLIDKISVQTTNINNALKAIAKDIK